MHQPDLGLETVKKVVLLDQDVHVPGYLPIYIYM